VCGTWQYGKIPGDSNLSLFYGHYSFFIPQGTIRKSSSFDGGQLPALKAHIT
jgi:hypothetical protein